MKKLLALALVLLMLAGCGAPASTAPATLLPENTATPAGTTAVPACTHVDGDDNGTCDRCGKSVIVWLDFYAFNDLHGVFHDTDTNPGVDELTTYLKDAYADDSAYEIVLSSGDMWQGTVESNANYGALMTEWMNDLGFVSMTMGNHEYDWGSDRIVRNAALAQFPFLGINVIDRSVEQPYCQASVVVERGGVRVGIIGAMGNCRSSISGEYNKNLDFLTGTALTELVKAEATRLRTEEECDLIVYSIHDDSSEYDEQLSNGYVDLVFEGHTHQKYVTTDSYGVYHLQSGGENQALSYVRMGYNTVNETGTVSTAQNLKNTVYGASSIADDPIVETLYQKYFPEDDPYTKVLGQNGNLRQSGEILRQMAQLYLQKGEQLWGETYDIVLGGGFMSCRSPYRLPAGDVTYAQLVSLLPFNNKLTLCAVSGADLRRVFLETQNSRYYVAVAGDLAVDDAATYYIVTDTYTSQYAPNRLTEVARFEEEYYARDLLADYIAGGNWE